MVHKVIIIGSGPAGLTSAIYTSRANLAPVLFEGALPGGPLMTTTVIENYPGFPEGVNGPDLIMSMRRQAENFGTKIISKNITKVDFSIRPFIVWADDEKYEAETIIIATGTEARNLGLDSEKRLTGKGISYCATCDGPLFKNKKLIVVGGGDAAMEEAIFLSKLAEEVVIINRSEKFKASDIMYERVKKNPKIKWLPNTEIKEFVGESHLEKVKIINNKTNEESEEKADGAFIAIGRIPNTKMFEGKLKMNKGYIITEPDSAKTSVEGVFAAGDASEWKYWQAITAAGKGCMAAKDADRYLDENTK
ncbi:MAG: thioredoxin-disulfide reductase [Parcubacteria group bacterium CG10_big_fil_rev_8_21_14_0_10_36_14]|nr:MAG: thioredoxin-disulfide reductase [Parcubacteria group bacterium CG10_big_fil_rev_8_21_14_0_10_36_14]